MKPPASAAATALPLTCDVLVVGGGFAGRAAARAAGVRGAHVVLVDAKTFFEYTPSAPRCVVCPRALAAATRPHAGAGRNVTILHGMVVRLADRDASVRAPDAGGGARLVRFRFCIWAGGTGYDAPIHASPASGSSLAARAAALGTSLEQLAAARSVLVLGGGLVGVELAAELAELRGRSGLRSPPPLRVTLASSGARLLPRLPRRAAALSEHFLAARGVVRVRKRLRPDCRKQPPSGAAGTAGAQIYVSEDASPTTVAADVVFDCTGARRRPAGEALRAYAESCGRGAFAPGRAGLVRLRDTLQLVGSDSVFVAGDAGVVDRELALEDDGGLGCEKTAYAAMEGGRVAAHNVTELLRGDGGAGGGKLRRFPKDAFGGAFPRMFLVSLGKWDGVVCLGPLAFGGPLAPLLKVVVEFVSVRAVSRGGLIDRVWTATERVQYSIVRGIAAVGRWHKLARRPGQHSTSVRRAR